MTWNSKPYFQKRLRPLTAVLATVGVTANQVTCTTMVLSLAAGAIILALPEARWPLFLVPAVLALRAVFNHIDGLLACEHGMKTDLGAILNELSDVVSDAALYLPLAAVPGAPAVLLVPMVALGLIAEMTGVVALRIGAERREDGPLGKKPRGLVFAATAIVLGLGVTPGPWLDGALTIALALLVVTIVNRARGALAQANARCLPA